MSKAAFPTGAEVGAFLITAGVVSAAPGDVDDWAAAAAREWERATGWKPFLKDSAFGVRRFKRPADGVLNLNAGLLELNSSNAVLHGVNYSSSGTALVETQDFVLEPENAADESRPYLQMRFLTGVLGWIDISAKWGYCAEMDEDAWTAILKRASSLQVVHLRGIGGIAKKIKQGPVEIEVDASKASIDVWDADFFRTVKMYQRIVC